MAQTTKQLLFVIAVLGLCSLSSTQNPNTRVECLDSCNVGGAILGRDPNIGACCGQRGSARNGGAFRIDGSACRSCEDFRNIGAAVNITVEPSPPMIGQNLELTCTVMTDPLLRAAGTLSFTLPNGNVEVVNITSPRTSLNFELTPLQNIEMILGLFSCNAMVSSPEYPLAFIQQSQSVAFDRSTVVQELRIEERGMPIAGQPYTLVCSVNDTTDMITWFGPDDQQLVTGGRVEVGDLVQQEGTTSRTLTINGLSEADLGTYTCRSGGAMVSKTLQIREPPALTTVEIITPPQPPQIGQPYEPECRVTPPEGLSGSANISVQWVGPDGVPIVTRTDTEALSLPLDFDTLEVSDAGLYVCMVVVTSPLLDTPQRISRTLNLTVETEDECTPGSDDCDPNAMCILLNGVRQCVCNQGFSGNGRVCEDEVQDECTPGSDDCDPNASCLLVNGVRRCVCDEGFSGNGQTCEAETDDQCTPGSDDCDRNATCVLVSGVQQCICNRGFSGNGIMCEELGEDECTPGSYDCDPYASCLLVNGVRRCVCDEGFTGNGQTCQDVNECAGNRANCSSNAKCKNTVGSFKCVCNPGFTGDGCTCEDINECATGKDNCHRKALCWNTVGSFACKCYRGFYGDGVNYCYRPYNKNPSKSKSKSKRKSKKSRSKGTKRKSPKGTRSTRGRKTGTKKGTRTSRRRTKSTRRTRTNSGCSSHDSSSSSSSSC